MPVILFLAMVLAPVVGFAVVMVALAKATGSVPRRPPFVTPPLTQQEFQQLQADLAALRDEMRQMREDTARHASSLDRNIDLLSERISRVEETAETPEQIQQRLEGSG
jgi:hypothetical protein